MGNCLVRDKKYSKIYKDYFNHTSSGNMFEKNYTHPSFTFILSKSSHKIKIITIYGSSELEKYNLFLDHCDENFLIYKGCAEFDNKLEGKMLFV